MVPNTSQVEQVLDWVRAHPLADGRLIPVCIWGQKGGGKTQLLRAYCAKRKLGFRGMHPAHNSTGSDIIGLAYFDPGIERTVRARPVWLPTDKDPITWNKRGLIFIDEINRSPKAVLQALMEPLGEGTIEQSDWRMPAEWGFVCAANPPAHGYDVTDLDDALMDRMLHIPLGFDLVRWIAWADATELPREILDFNAQYPDLMQGAEIDIGELGIGATPRSMEYLAHLYEPGMDRDLLRMLAEGLIGSEAARAFIQNLDDPDVPISAMEVLSRKFHDRLADHLRQGREDLIGASQDLLSAKLAGVKFRKGQDEAVAEAVAEYASMLGRKRAENLLGKLADNSSHWHGPVKAAVALRALDN